MPYGYNRDADTLNSIGENLGSIVGTFIKNRRLKKSRLALEREQQAKANDLISQKKEYLLKQIGPDDTDLYTQLTDTNLPGGPKPNKSGKQLQPEALSMIEQELTNRNKMRADQAKVDADAQKELDKQTKEEEKLKRKSDVLSKIINDDESVPQEQKNKFLAYIDGSEEGYDAAKTLFTKWKPEKTDKKTLAEEKTELETMIRQLGKGSLKEGLPIYEKNDPAGYYRARALGIDPEKEDKDADPSKPYVEQIQREFTVARKEDATLDLKKFAVDWMKAREVFIPEEVRKKILGKLYPERTSLGAEGVTEKNPDDARAEELSAKLKSDPASLSDEELDWLEQYRKSQSAAN